jgi:vacuolar protein 8
LIHFPLPDFTEVRPVEQDTLEPIQFLLQSHDVEVQRAASAALGNLAVNGVYLNISRCHSSGSRTVNDLVIAACVWDFCGMQSTVMALFTEKNKVLIVKLGGLEPLIRQMLSPNVEVQCNAVGCITNLATHGENIPPSYDLLLLTFKLKMKTRPRLPNRAHLSLSPGLPSQRI